MHSSSSILTSLAVNIIVDTQNLYTFKTFVCCSFFAFVFYLFIRLASCAHNLTLSLDFVSPTASPLSHPSLIPLSSLSSAFKWHFAPFPFFRPTSSSFFSLVQTFRESGLLLTIFNFNLTGRRLPFRSFDRLLPQIVVFARFHDHLAIQYLPPPLTRPTYLAYLLWIDNFCTSTALRRSIRRCCNHISLVESNKRVCCTYSVRSILNFAHVKSRWNSHNFWFVFHLSRSIWFTSN